MAVELRIPQSGESITEVQIGEWLKAEGDYVRVDEPVVEIETDKASMELPAPVSGRIAKRLKQVGEIVGIGEVICLIDETAAVPAGGGDGRGAATAPAASAAPTAKAPAPAPTAEPRIMPAARRALAEHGLPAADVTPTGPGGRLLKEDVQRHIAGAPGRARSASEGVPGAPLAAAIAPDVDVAAGLRPGRLAPAVIPTSAGTREEEAVPMTMLRRRIAERLVQAQQTAALLTTFNEIDMAAVLALRKQYNDAFEKKYGIKLGLMSFFVKAAIDALKRWPAANAEIRGTDIAYKNYYDVGIAVSTEQGLVVPVVRNAERLSFAEVELAIADLATRARQRKITVEELQGGTFTITNGGVFGSLLATPIINPPQSAILGLHTIQDRPVARDGQVVIRPMMYVALTYDHRIIDGRESVSFLKRIKECVEDPGRMLLEI